MGESKLPKAPPPAPVRPGMSIIRMLAALQEYEKIPISQRSEDDAQWMGDMRAVMDWLAVLETPAPSTPVQ